MSHGYYQPYWENNRNELEHFGIKGMKWGIRRYQNPDGTLTDAGKKRYGTAEKLEEAKKKSVARKEKAIKFAKTAVKTTAIIGLGAMSANIMGTTINKALSYTSPEAAKTVNYLTRYGTTTVSGVTVGIPSSSNQGRLSAAQYNKLAQLEVQKAWDSYYKYMNSK